MAYHLFTVHRITKLIIVAKGQLVFYNRKVDKLKILHWKHNGCWFFHRFEKGKFNSPVKNNAEAVSQVSQGDGRLCDKHAGFSKY
jgi:hypothetical protein